MSNEIQKIDNNTQVMTREKIVKYLQVCGLIKKMNSDQAEMFVAICQEFGLNPFKREVYGIIYMQWNDEKNKKEPILSIITGYESYIKRAERTGLLAGWKPWTTGSIKNGDLKAHIKIKRKDWPEYFEHEVDFEEYNQGNKMWKAKPITMLKKVAISQGFRLCFSEDMGGMPYTAEELPENMSGPPPDIKEEDESAEPKKVEGETTKIEDGPEENENDYTETDLIASQGFDAADIEEKFKDYDEIAGKSEINKYIIEYIKENPALHEAGIIVLDSYFSCRKRVERAACILKAYQLHPAIQDYKVGENEKLYDILNEVIESGGEDQIIHYLKTCLRVLNKHKEN